MYKSIFRAFKSKNQSDNAIKILMTEKLNYSLFSSYYGYSYSIGIITNRHLTIIINILLL